MRMKICVWQATLNEEERKGRYRSISEKKRCYGPVSKTFWWVQLKSGNQGDNGPDESCKYMLLELNAAFLSSKIPPSFGTKRGFRIGNSVVYLSLCLG
jgi:hypothetical protein